jgi:hypothetical protein
VTASGVLHVNEHCQLTQLTVQRSREERDHYQLEPWTAQSNEYQEVEEMRIPTKSEVTWFRFKITEIEYDQSGKVTRL